MYQRESETSREDCVRATEEGMQIAKRYEVAKEFIAQHEGQGTLWQDECRSLLDRYDSDVSEFQSEQKMAVAEKLQMNIVEHDSARTSARISALEREFSELKSRSAVFWKMSWVQPARDFDFCNPQPDQTCGTDLS